MEKINYISKLREQFIAKINSDWVSKWANKHGENFIFSELKSQNAFLDDLAKDIENSLKKTSAQKQNINLQISTDSLRRILNKDKQNSWQEKTRQTIAYYVGYDGWEDFENCNPVTSTSTITVREAPRTSSKSTFRFSKFAISAIIVAISLIGFAVYKMKNVNNVEKDRFKIVQTNYVNDYGYPKNISILYDLTDIEYQNAEIAIIYESLQYPDRESYKLDAKKGSKEFTIHTPGVKTINLLADGKLIKQILYIVPTVSDWYGCARIKAKELAIMPIDTGRKYYWYGRSSLEANSTDDWITPPTIWKKYIGLEKGKSSYPSGSLHFPEEPIKASGKNVFSRVLFMKCDSFPVDMNNMSISFRAKREDVVEENCLSMMLQLWDEDRSQVLLQSNNLCNTRNVILEKKFYNKTTGEIIGNTNYNENQLNYTIPKLNDWLNDHKWHNFRTIILNGIVTLVVDNVTIAALKNTIDYKDLRTIRIVFEGNGYIDDVEVKNTITNKVIFADNFNN